MTKKAAPVLAMDVTNVKVRRETPFVPYRRYDTGYGSRFAALEPKLCLTGYVDGERVWVKFPAYVGLGKDEKPMVAIGDTVGFKARKSGQSDDGGITFMNHAKLVAIVDGDDALPVAA